MTANTDEQLLAAAVLQNAFRNCDTYGSATADDMAETPQTTAAWLRVRDHVRDELRDELAAQIRAEQCEANFEAIYNAIDGFLWDGEGNYDELLARHIAAALNAPRRTITAQQLREGMTVRVESERRGRRDTYTLTIAKLVGPLGPGVLAVSTEGGTLRATATDTIIWLGGTEPEPVDPDARIKDWLAGITGETDADGLAGILAQLRTLADVTPIERTKTMTDSTAATSGDWSTAAPDPDAKLIADMADAASEALRGRDVRLELYEPETWRIVARAALAVVRESEAVQA